MEYLLAVAAVAMLAFGGWSLWVSSQEPMTTVSQEEEQMSAGTEAEIGSLTAGEMQEEISLDKENDAAEAESEAGLQGTADNIGGAYDETAY